MSSPIRSFTATEPIRRHVDWSQLGVDPSAYYEAPEENAQEAFNLYRELWDS